MSENLRFGLSALALIIFLLCAGRFLKNKAQIDHDRVYASRAGADNWWWHHQAILASMLPLVGMLLHTLAVAKAYFGDVDTRLFIIGTGGVLVAIWCGSTNAAQRPRKYVIERSPDNSVHRGPKADDPACRCQAGNTRKGG